MPVCILIDSAPAAAPLRDQVLVIPLMALSQVILERPDMLRGMDWLLEENTFVASQNHIDLLLVMGQISGGRVSPSGPLSPGEERQNARRAAIAKEKEGTIVACMPNLISFCALPALVLPRGRFCCVKLY